MANKKDLKGKHQIVEVRVGWHDPKENDLVLNLHLYLEQYNWCEVIQFAQLEDLHQSLMVYTFGLTDPSKSSKSPAQNPNLNPTIVAHVPFPNTIFENFEIIRDFLHFNEFELEVNGFLQQYSQSLEAWISCIMNSIHFIDKESQKLCKQLFFKSYIQVSLYDLLYDLLTLQFEQEQKQKKLMRKPSNMQGSEMMALTAELRSKSIDDEYSSPSAILLDNTEYNTEEEIQKIKLLLQTRKLQSMQRLTIRHFKDTDTTISNANTNNNDDISVMTNTTNGDNNSSVTGEEQPPPMLSSTLTRSTSVFALFDVFGTANTDETNHNTTKGGGLTESQQTQLTQYIHTLQSEGMKCMYLVPLITDIALDNNRTTTTNSNNNNNMKKIPVQKYPATLFLPCCDDHTHHSTNSTTGSGIGGNKIGKKKNCIEITIESEKYRSKLIFDYKELACIDQGYGQKNTALHKTLLNIDPYCCMTIQTITSQEVMLLFKCNTNGKDEIPLIIQAMHAIMKNGGNGGTTGTIGTTGSEKMMSTISNKKLKNQRSKSLHHINSTYSMNNTSLHNIHTIHTTDDDTHTMNQTNTYNKNTSLLALKRTSSLHAMGTKGSHNDGIKILSYHWVGIKLHNTIFMPSYLRRLLIFRSDRMIEVFSIPKDHDLGSSSTNNSNQEEVMKKRKECCGRLQQFIHTPYQQPYVISRGFELQRQFVFDALKSFHENTSDDTTIEMTIGNKKFDAKFEDTKSCRAFVEVLFQIIKN